MPTAHDPRANGDVDLSSSVTTTSNTVNDSQVGTYSVAYSVSDGTNTTTATRSVTVVDSTQPVITLSGDGLSSDSRLTFMVNTYTDWNELSGAVDVTFTATDDGDDVSSLVQIDTSGVLWSTPGNYEVLYDLSDPTRGPTASQRTRYLTIEGVDYSQLVFTGSGIPGLTAQLYTGNYSEDRDWFEANPGNKSGDSTVITDLTYNEGLSNPNLYSYNYTGAFVPHVSGTWTFWTTSDDGSNVWIDNPATGVGTHVVDNGGQHSTRTYSGTIDVVAGTVYDIQVAYEDYSGGGEMRMDYQAPGLSRIDGALTSYNNTIFQSAVITQISASNTGMILPVMSGLLAHYSWYSWKSATTWEDLSGNGNHMTNVLVGSSALVTAENANMTDNDTGARFPYIAGNSSSRWDMAGMTGSERMPMASWTYIHIHRYDPAGADKDGRVLGTVGDDAMFGTWNGYVGVSNYDGWVGGHPANVSYNQRYPYNAYQPTAVPPRYGGHWVFQIERPGVPSGGRYSRTTTKDNSWTEFSVNGPGTPHSNMMYRPTLNNDQNGENADWNVAELIIFNRILTNEEIESFKTWLMAYKNGMIHEQYPAGVVLPVQTGLTAHHSWFSFQDDNTWEDLSGNGHHATRQGSGSGTVSLVSAADANTTGFGGLGPWPYISGDTISRWDLFAGLTLDSAAYTIVYIMRYDVNPSYRGRIIDMKIHNYLIGAWGGQTGRSHHGGGGNGFLNYSPPMQNTEWVLGIEMHDRQVRRGTVTTQWADNTGVQHSHTYNNLVATINNGAHSGESSDYNIAEIIYYNRVFTESEISEM